MIQGDKMDHIIAFMRDFTAIDLAVAKADALMDQENYPQLIAQLKTFFARNVSPGRSLALSPHRSENAKRALAEQALELVPRILFKVKRWRHKSEGVLFQAYVSTTHPDDPRGYFQSLLVKADEARPTIVARYVVCYPCFATGQRDGQRCTSCHVMGWEYREGLKLIDFGVVQETRRLEPPHAPAFLPEYESD